MLKQVSIRNYQSLRALDLLLGRVTVITGHSDSGKSALVRAIQTAVFNLEGNSFLHKRLLSDGSVRIESPAAVALVDESGDTVVWRRYEKDQMYLLLKPDGTKLEFRKMGGTIPAEILAVLGMESLLIEEKKHERVHFSFQYDQPFLVADRGGVGANRVLGRLTGLHIFSNAAKQCTQAKSDLSSKLKFTKDSLESTNQRIADIPDITAFMQVLTDVKARKVALNSKAQSRLALQEAKTNLIKHFNDLKQYRKDIEIRLDPALIKRMDELEVKINSWQARKELWSKLVSFAKQRGEFRSNLVPIPVLDSKKVELHEQLKLLWIHKVTGEQNVDTNQKIMAGLSEEHRKLKQEYDLLVSSNPFCQTCGRPLAEGN